ncbi:MAG: D-Ala-D-Ala carboxypeptidase family metallohydrolase [Cyanobacteria bacterium P01_F01_bin.150]
MADAIKALRDTWLKKDYRYNAVELADDQKVEVLKGKTYFVTVADEQAASIEMGGHFQVDLEYGAGTWFIYAEHWQLPWQAILDTPPPKRPEWNEVNWSDWSAPVSKYFTVGEVTNLSRERIPTETNIKKNIIAIARHMDDIREWWGGPLGVNSWYRPWHVNTRIGSRAPNHPNGYGIDFRPLNGSVWELQKRFQSEWYNEGKWSGGFGLGARKGFIHLDLRGKRIWNY